MLSVWAVGENCGWKGELSNGVVFQNWELRETGYRGTRNGCEACCETQRRPEKELRIYFGRSGFMKWTKSSRVTADVHKQFSENY